jgi:tRNA-guanine family transglycosylase
LGWDDSERPGEEWDAGAFDEGQRRWIGPDEVLKTQTQEAEMGWALDLPCTGETDPAEGERRLRLTVANARWARSQEVGGLDLWGAVVGWSEESFARCAQEMVALGYGTLVVSGLWGWMKQPGEMCRIVEAVRQQVGDSVSLHVTGIGNPEVAKRLSARGVESMDGASYVRAADRGVQWDANRVLADGSKIEKAHMAIANAALIGRELEAGRRSYLFRRGGAKAGND